MTSTRVVQHTIGSAPIGRRATRPPPGPADRAADEWLTSCPACGGTAITPAFWGRSRHRDLWYHYFRCARCSLVFVSPRVPAETQVHSMEHVQHSRRLSGHPFHEVFSRKLPFDSREFTFNIVAPAARLLPPRIAEGRRARWLDVGCASGNLLETVHRLGYEPHGLELNRSLVDWAREHRPHLPIVRGLISDLPRGQRYDVISADNVLEHVHEPAPFLAEVRERLAEKSLLIVRVPNHDNALRPLLQKMGRLPTSYLVDPDAHPCNYNRRSLVALLTRTGFEPVRVSEHLMLSYPLKHVLLRRTIRWAESRREVLARLYPLVFLFDRIVPRGGIDVTIFAVKKRGTDLAH